MSVTPQDIGNLAKWTVSSRKFGFGMQFLRDDDSDTYWQSEGPQPHNIDLSFPRKVFVSSVSLLLNHHLDDSYTPERICISLGTTHYDLIEVRKLHLDKPNGWMIFSMRSSSNSDAQEDPLEPDGPPLPAFHVRIQIVGNHLNGKDTHVRGIRVFGIPGTTISANHPSVSREPESTTSSRGKQMGTRTVDPEIARGLRLMEEGEEDFITLEYRMHRSVR